MLLLYDTVRVGFINININWRYLYSPIYVYYTIMYNLNHYKYCNNNVINIRI